MKFKGEKNQFLIDTIWAIVGRYIKFNQFIIFFTSIVSQYRFFFIQFSKEKITIRKRQKQQKNINFKLSPKPISNPSRYVIQFYFFSIFLFISLYVKIWWNGVFHKKMESFSSNHIRLNSDYLSKLCSIGLELVCMLKIYLRLYQKYYKESRSFLQSTRLCPRAATEWVITDTKTNHNLCSCESYSSTNLQKVPMF